MWSITSTAKATCPKLAPNPTVRGCVYVFRTPLGENSRFVWVRLRPLSRFRFPSHHHRASDHCFSTPQDCCGHFCSCGVSRGVCDAQQMTPQTLFSLHHGWYESSCFGHVALTTKLYAVPIILSLTSYLGALCYKTPHNAWRPDIAPIVHRISDNFTSIFPRSRCQLVLRLFPPSRPRGH
jgi:hypothetical protein